MIGVYHTRQLRRRLHKLGYPMVTLGEIQDNQRKRDWHKLKSRRRMAATSRGGNRG